MEYPPDWVALHSYRVSGMTATGVIPLTPGPTPQQERDRACFLSMTLWQALGPSQISLSLSLSLCRHTE